MRDNFGARVSMGRLSPAGAQMMWGSPHIGVAVPRGKRGRGVAISDDGTPVEIQTYYAPNPDPAETSYDVTAVTAVRPTTTIHQPLTITQLHPDLHEDEESEPTWHDYAAAPIVPLAHTTPVRPVAPTHPDGPVREESAALHDSFSPAGVDTTAEDEQIRGYGDPQHELAAHLEPGALLRAPDTDTWVVLERAEEDPLDEDNLILDVREFFTGEPETLSVPADSFFTTRVPDLTDT